MKRRYVTVDVFTDRMFGGNAVAVVLDVDGLSDNQMQAIAIEFNYSETTFILPPKQPDHSARVRIFTPSSEVPFAGAPECRDRIRFGDADDRSQGESPRRVRVRGSSGARPRSR